MSFDGFGRRARSRRAVLFGVAMLASAGTFATAVLAPARPLWGLASCDRIDLCMEWHTVVDPLGGFRISFPSKPKYTVKQMETGAGRMTVHAYNLEEGPVSWAASWSEFPPAYVRNMGTVRLLEGAKEAYFKRFKGKFLSEKIVQLGAAPGRDAVFETEDDVRMRLRMFLRGNKLIQTLAIAEPDMIDGPDAQRFFGSLKWE